MLGNGNFELDFIEIPSVLTVRDMNGSLVLALHPEHKSVHIDLSTAAAGIYQVLWESQAGQNRFALPVLK